MISLRGVVKRHGALEVVRGVDLDVRRGEVAAIVGPSGAGKTTLLRCVNGLEPFHAGQITVGDAVLKPLVHPRRDAALLERVRRRVGFVFQQFNLFPHLSALENVVEAPLRVLREPRDRAVARGRELLERVGLAAKADAMPRRLSGGEQQRVAIARALAMRPEAILFDEPTSALDGETAAEVLAVIADLARAGQTMIVVTHALDFARSAATTVHVFADGRVTASGPPAEVLGDGRRSAAAGGRD